MQFIPLLTSFLAENRTIYTLRAYNYTTSNCWVQGVGYCSRRLVMFYPWGPAQEDLEPYVASSGFASVVEWLKMLDKLAPKAEIIYLWRVTVI